MLRATPGLRVWRPCDATETVVAWQAAIERKEGPTALILTRQAVPAQMRDAMQLQSIARGGYILLACELPEVILMATGSEIALCIEAAHQAAMQGVKVQVVSLPCWEVFDAQPDDYREKVLPFRVKARVVVEAGATLGWHKYVGSQGRIVGIDRYGESAPYTEVYRALGLTVEAILAIVLEVGGYNESTNKNCN